MPWQTLCKHRTALPWRLWSIISKHYFFIGNLYSSAVVLWERGGKPFFFVFHLIVDRLTLWPVLLVSVRKRIFSPSYLKMKFQGESERSFSSFLSKQCLHSKRGKMKSKCDAFSSAGEGRCSFWKGTVQPLQISFSETFDGVFKTQWRYSALASVEPRSGLQRLALTRRAGPRSWKRGRKTGPSC